MDAKYQPEIETETNRIQKLIDEAAEKIISAKPPAPAARKKMYKQEIKSTIDAAKITAKRMPEWKNQMVEARRELRAYEKQMAKTKIREARQLLKEQINSPVFLYDTQHVGITATGDQDVCELLHRETLGLPVDFKLEDTALVQYRSFCEKPESFMLNIGNSGGEA